MNKRISIFTLFVVGTLLLGLVGAIAALAAPSAAVRGTTAILNPADTTKTLAWAKQGGDITLEVRDADLNVPIKRIIWPDETTLMTGTVSTTAASTVITGAGTIFSSELVVGDTILVGAFPGTEKVREIASIASDTQLAVKRALDNTNAGLALREVNTAGALAAVCPDCAAAHSLTLVDTEVISDLLSIQDTNVGVSVANRFAGAADTALNVNDVRVVRSDGADVGDLVLSVDFTNGTLTTSAATGTAYALFWSGAINTTGTTVKVTSQANTAGISATLTETGARTGVFRKQITLCGTSGCSTDEVDIEVGLNDLVKLNYTDVSPSPSTTVVSLINIETTDPGFSNFAPTHKSGTQNSRPVVSADVTDSDSLAKKTSLRVFFALDTTAPFDNVVDNAGEADPNDIGTVGTIASGFNFEQRLLSALAPTGDAQLFWWVVGDDTAGNRGVSDRLTAITVGTVTTADACDPDAFPTAASSLVGQTIDDTVANSYRVNGCQPYLVKIDFTSPDMSSGKTGPWWDTSKTTTDKTETLSSKARTDSILVTFNESLDGTTVQPSDFTVGGVIPVAAQHFSGANTGVFLTVSTMLPDAKPVIKLVGEVKDVAGNILSIDEVTSADGIGPAIAVTVTGTAAGAIPVTKDKVTVQFTTNEAATVSTGSVTVTRAATASTLGTPEGSVAPSLVTANTWKVEMTPAAPGLFNVYVTSNDLGANAGTSGHITDPSNKVAILFEKDTTINAPAFTPAVDTDDPNAFVVVNFASEGAEYGLDSAGNFTTTLANVVTSKDTHKTVTLTKATLDAVDILPSVSSQDNIIFLYSPTTPLALGDHTLKVTATDEAGNALGETTHTFKVKAKVLTKVTMQPGQNLISLPSTPVSTGINSVGLPTDVKSVITYDPTPAGLAAGGPWLVATRDASGNLVGTLTALDARHAYWVETITFAPIQVDIPPQGFAATPPSIEVVNGWNLVPVVSVSGGAPGTTINADVYFSSVAWVTAYSFDTLTKTWTKVTPGNFQTVTIGKGYWLYAGQAGVLVP